MRTDASDDYPEYDDDSEDRAIRPMMENKSKSNSPTDNDAHSLNRLIGWIDPRREVSETVKQS